MTETAPARIFLSHSTQDTAFCDALVAALRQAGVDVWYDQQSLGPGVLLRREIMRQLSDRPIFIVVLSKAACASQWVKDECEWAYDLWREEQDARVLLPVLAGPLERADFAELLYLKSMRRVEGDNLHPLPQQDAIAEVLRLLGLTQAPPPVAPLITPPTPPPAPAPAESADDLIERGAELHRQGKYAEALAVYEQALGLDPKDARVWVGKAYALLERNRDDEALAACERALELNPKDAKAWVGKGFALRGLDRDTEALDAYERALALDPNNAQAWFGKSDALYMLGRDDEAETAQQRWSEQRWSELGQEKDE